jgi:hypothetical protein
MNEHSKAALKIALDEAIKRREELGAMADQYELRAKNIRTIEIEELSEKIRGLQADLE